MAPTANRTPVYQQIAGHIAAQIAKGEIGEGDPIPSLAGIATDWGVSLPTAREALAQLQKAGLVAVIPGRPTVVATAREVHADMLVAFALGLAEGDPVRMQKVGASVVFTRLAD